MTSKVSVVIATFRPNPDFLEMQIDSILDQTRAVDEIILRDDASGSDFSGYLLGKVAAKDPRISVHIGKVNIGYGANFIEGARLTHGDYVFFSDQDDVWHPDKVEKVLAEFERSKALLVFHDQERVFADLSPKHAMTSEVYAKHGVTELFVHGCTTAISNRLMPLLLSKPVGFAHDEWMHHLATYLGQRSFLGEALMKYRIHEASASRTKPLEERPQNRFEERVRFRTRKLKQRLEVNNAISAALVEDPTLLRAELSVDAVLEELAIEKHATDQSLRILAAPLTKLPVTFFGAVTALGTDFRAQSELFKDTLARAMANW